MSADAVSFIGQFVQWGALGFLALSLMFGLVVPAWTYRKAEKDTAAWKGLYESERAAHQHTRDAYTLQGERLQVAIESGRVTEQLLLEARRHVAATPE